MEVKNHLGLDKFQLTIIKGNYNSIKPSLTKRDKAVKKMEETIQKFREKLDTAVASLKQEVDAYNQQIAMIDKFTLEITEKSCGIALTTEQVIEFLDSPEKFEEYKKSIGLGNDLFNEEKNSILDEVHNQTEIKAGALTEDKPKDLDEEEDKEWEDRIESGELKEAI